MHAHWARWIRFSSVLSLVVVVTLSTRPAHAVLQLVSDAITATSWPGEAPVRTSYFSPDGGTRGVRGEREHYQTFSVAEAFSLDSLFIQYEWALTAANAVNFPWETNPTKVTLYEITRIVGGDSLENSFTLGNVVIPETSFIVNGADKIVGQRYGIELDWDAGTSGELILQPRTGVEGYALNIQGTHSGPGSSAISLIQRGDNSYPGNGRAYEFIANAESGPFTNKLFDFPIVLTAVPDPFLDGDFNQDGTVDAADYAMWRKTNESDMTAYNTWVQYYGMSNAGSGGVHRGVPEPAGLMLLVPVALLGYVSSLRRREKRTVGVTCHVTNVV